MQLKGSQAHRIWYIQLLQLGMNRLLVRENTLEVLAIRSVTKLGRHEQLDTRRLCLFCEQVLCLERGWGTIEGGDHNVRSCNGVHQRLR